MTDPTPTYMGRPIVKVDHLTDHPPTDQEYFFRTPTPEEMDAVLPALLDKLDEYFKGKIHDHTQDPHPR